MNFKNSLAAGLALFLAPNLAGALESYHSYTSPVLHTYDFGQAISVSDGLLHVGNMGNYDDGTFTIYRYDLATGAYLGEVNSPFGAAEDYFGTALAAANGTVLAGAPNTSTLDHSAVGVAYLLDANTGALQQVLANPTPSDGRIGGERFGTKVAQDGRYALVAGYYENEVSVFDLANPDCTGGLGNPCAGTLINTLASPADTDADFYSNSPAIAIDAGRALLGDRELDVGGVSDVGGAQLIDVVTGDVLQSFANPDPAPNSTFGVSVAISGDFVLIGDAPNNYGSDSFVYLFSASSGALLHTFAGDDYGAYGYLGAALAISGDYALIGADGGVGSRSNDGFALLVDLSDFSLVEKLTGTNREYVEFGYAVALGDGYVAVSEPSFYGDDVNGVVRSWALPDSVSSVPVPSAAPMLMFGVAAIMISRRRRKA